MASSQHEASGRPLSEEPPRPPRILLVHVTAGAGHQRAAEALTEAIRQQLPQAEVSCCDLLEDLPRFVRWVYPWTYYVLVQRFSSLWGFVFSLLDHPVYYALAQPFRRTWNLLAAARFIRRLRQAPPDLVIATHFFPADILSAGKRAGWCTVPLVVVITDWHPHRFWLTKQVDAYVVATAEGVKTVSQRGMAAGTVHALGIPIASSFTAPLDHEQVRQRFGLLPGHRTILVTSGGRTVGPFQAVVKALMALEATRPQQLQLLVVCGHDRAAFTQLERWSRQSVMPVRVFGFIDAMPEAMGVSDLVVAKAGGMTVTEVLRCAVPLILYHAIPGQEQSNAQYVAHHGAAIIANTPQEVARVALRMVDDPTECAAMRQAARALSRPDAASAIVSQVVIPLLHDK